MSCDNNSTSEIGKGTNNDSLITSTDSDWQSSFRLTHDPNKDSVWGKPVSFYINNPDCNGLAKKFYAGELKPDFSDSTYFLLELTSTENETLRPFYRWCLDKTIQIGKGMMNEMAGIPAEEYLEKYPQEFLTYMDSDSSGERIQKWLGAISAGLSNVKEDSHISWKRSHLKKNIRNNCRNCDQDIIKRLDSLLNTSYNRLIK